MRLRIASALILGCLACRVAAEDASSTRFVELAAYPPHIALHRADEDQSLVAVARQADGLTIDVTDLASWRVAIREDADASIHLDNGAVLASADGMARLACEFGGLRAEIDIQATGVAQAPAVSYRHDVLPVLTRTGCNAGGCHGASRGKDGFRLSLFGFDPAGDHHRLTRELPGRRINLAIPEESLLLMKSIGGVTHTGGKRFESDSIYYQKLHDWIAAGAGNDLDGVPTVTGVAIYPPRAAIGAGGQSQRFVVVAEYSDGRSRDVTHLAVFQSSNDSSAKVDDSGIVVSDRRGEAFVTARFDTHTVGAQVLVLPTDEPFEPVDEAPANYVDELVGEKLRTLRVNPSQIATDEEFLRRVTIDVAGRLPTVEELDAFLADPRAEKRSAKVDELLADPGFAHLWGQKWSDLLLVRTEPNRVEYKPMFLYSQWLTSQIAAGRPLDEMIRDLIAASGTTFDTPQTNFYQIEQDSKKIAENVAQTFLGIRLQCAQCHNHPFDRWTMDDYYAFTAFFSQISRKRTDDYREWVIKNRGAGEAKHPVGGGNVPPKFLGGDTPETRGKDRRAVAADWLVSPDNPWFARSVANRVWAHFFGVGIVDPVDDIRVSNPPSNPALFDEMGSRLVGYDYDVRRLIRDITGSNAYQRSCEPTTSNADDTRNFARSQARRIPAEVLLDCLSQATDSPEKLPNLPLGARATQIADGRAGNYFLTTFGRSRRDTVCACEAKGEPTLSQALHLMNGSTVTAKIGRGKLVKRRLESGVEPHVLIDELFLRTLSRRPTAEERSELVHAVGDADKPIGELEDIFWALLNSREFLFNH